MSTADAPLPAAPTIEGAAPHVLVVRAPYYTDIVDGLRDGALRIITEAGGTADVLDVAGALELASTVLFAVKGTRRRYDAFVTLGCVVKGETDHYTFICDAISHGVMGIAAETGAAIGFGLLTVDTLQQAIARSSDDKHNKGAEAMHALLTQVGLRRRWGIK